MNKFIYLDTNIFLHYKPFTEINWLEIVNAESVTIVIPPIIIRELNKHKDSHSLPHVRKRASEIIKKLSGILDSGSTSEIQNKILVQFEDRDSNIDYAVHQLNFNIQDDQLIASILAMQQEMPQAHIVLVTSDLGLALMVKAGRQGINVAKMPDSLRRNDELDANEKKIKQLEQKIQDLTSRVPNLTLLYDNEQQLLIKKLLPPTLLKKSDIELKISEIGNGYQKQLKNQPKTYSQNLTTRDLEKALADNTAFTLGWIPQSENERYKNEIEKYIAEYIKFLESDNDHQNLKRRIIRLDLALINNGTSPADDVDVYLHFPGGFRVLEEKRLPRPPKPPKEPIEPRTQGQLLSSAVSIDSILTRPSSIISQLSSSTPSLQNVSSFHIKQVNGYEVHTHIHKVKHNLKVFLDPLFVIFDAFEAAKSFSINYKVLADNIPQEINGELHLVVQRE